jgi:redox-sensing transcriptional repressor
VTSTRRRVSESAVRRLSIYLRTLEELEREGEDTVSSRTLAHRAGTTAAQVRKDLSLFGSFGKRVSDTRFLPFGRTCETSWD